MTYKAFIPLCFLYDTFTPPSALSPSPSSLSVHRALRRSAKATEQPGTHQRHYGHRNAFRFG
ncbi:hypothetical protein HanXRQr2_Chr17g0781171 [Helianthus annuus]|uniref:Uncharacterized protein n=1 Tax=Helianthus annuus TaxID=4232 RepID=A0A9K3DDP6_HELAN|nr:hypothetical protein HanXRQr2_Chr17g0781171 [Helianthus annuus]KAJ0811320.1 hypothetical protein HanPSC8_Chr17g0749421 [Helianthus annuus]